MSIGHARTSKTIYFKLILSVVIVIYLPAIFGTTVRNYHNKTKSLNYLIHTTSHEQNLDTDIRPI